tara:strand:- start:4634 stop:5215 length:582 start_codon:yes stop_codon:yes gene_type:complete
MKLVEIVNDQIKQGKSEDEIVNLLISSGLDEVRARHVFKTVKSSRSSHFSGIVRFVAIVLAILSSLSFIIFITIGESQFVALAKQLAVIFFICFVLFGIMSSARGKAMVYAKLVNSVIWLASSFMLTLAMFLHPGWDSKWFGTGGGWRGQIVSLLGNAIYNIGSTGVAYIFATLSILILLLFWAETHMLKTQK